MKTVTVKEWKCERCGHRWIGRKRTKPIQCPLCHVPKWDVKKK